MKTYLGLLAFLLLNVSCKKATTSTQSPELSIMAPVQTESQDGLKKAYFASGCFWCGEAVFESVKGVSEAVSGYSGGTEENPTYQQVGTGKTGHAEAVEVIYDPKIVDYQTLVDVFFGSQDPTTLNRQGPDRGTQYRSIAFYQNNSEKKIIETMIEKLNKSTYDGEIVTEVMPFQKFWKAEDYHQGYEKNHPNDSYVRSVSIPRLNKFKEKFPELLKDEDHL